MSQIALLAAGLLVSSLDPVPVGLEDGPAWLRTEFRASGFGVSLQHEAVVAADEGGLVASWASRRQQAGRYGVFARRFDLGGTPLGEERAVNLFRGGAQRSPALAAGGGEGGAGPLALWTSGTGERGRGTVLVARAPGPDFRRGAEAVIDDAGALAIEAPTLVATDRGFLAAWTRVMADAARPGGVRFEVAARPLAADGDPIGPARVVSFGADARGVRGAVLARIGDGRVLMVASVLDDAARALGLRTLVLDDAGGTVGGPAALGGAGAIEPALATLALASGEIRAVAAWMQPTELGYDVVAAGLDACGRPLGAPEIVAGGAVRPEAVREGPPAIAVLDDERDRLLVAWGERNAVGADGKTDLLARAIDAAGAPLAPTFPLARAVDGPQRLTETGGGDRLVALPGGGVAVAWSGDGGFGDGSAAHVTVLHPAVRPRGAGAVEGDGPYLAAAAAPDLDASAMPHRPPLRDPESVDPEATRTVRIGAGDEVAFDGVLATGWTPPDPQMGVGPDHVVAMTNGAIRVFDKQGTELFADEIEDDFGFWGEVGATGFVFDPEVLWDPHAERFWVMAAEAFAPIDRSYVLLAASVTSDPTGPWFKWRIDTTTLAGSLFDSPNVGVDESAVYITGDAFNGPPGPSYPMLVFNKAVLLGGGLPVPVNVFQIPTSTQSAGLPPVTSGAGGTLYLIEHLEGGTDTAVRLVAIRGGLGTPQIDSILVTVPPYTEPTDPPQAGTTVRPNTFDARFWSAAWRDGRIYGTHHVGSTRVLVRWYEIDVQDWPESGTPVLVQSGEIDPGPGIHTFFSAIALSGTGDLGLTFAQSSASDFISMQTAVRASTDPPGTVRTPVERQENVGPYTQARWGDYAGMDGDPADPQRLWAHHEYAAGLQWRTWIVGFDGPTPAGPAADLDGDGEVGFSDLLILLAAWGDCPPGPACPIDLDGSGAVDFADLLELLAAWTAA